MSAGPVSSPERDLQASKAARQSIFPKIRIWSWCAFGRAVQLPQKHLSLEVAPFLLARSAYGGRRYGGREEHGMCGVGQSSGLCRGDGNRLVELLLADKEVGSEDDSTMRFQLQLSPGEVMRSCAGNAQSPVEYLQT